MIDLSNRKELLTLDKSGAIVSIEQLPLQCRQAWTEAKQIELPSDYKSVKQVVVCGMGASWLGAHIMQGMLADRLSVPLIVCHDYQLPNFVNSDTLVIASSYSGTTEETVAGLHEAFTKKAKIITISTGGNLSEFAQQNNLPNYTFVSTHNPAKTPRLGLGYSIMAQLAFLKELSIVDVTDDEISQTISESTNLVNQLKPESTNNPAQQMANNIKGYIPIICSGTFLLGVAHAFSNQFNETAKTFATFMHIPELNHHLMEGLAHPQEVAKLKFLFLESSLYEKQIQKRFTVTKEVVERYKISHLTFKTQGTTKLSQALNTLLFGSFVTYYLAMLHGVDPSPNPFVDYFKKRLKELA